MHCNTGAEAAVGRGTHQGDMREDERVGRIHFNLQAMNADLMDPVRRLLMRESNVVHISAPVTVVGDIHG